MPFVPKRDVGLLVPRQCTKELSVAWYFIPVASYRKRKATRMLKFSPDRGGRGSKTCVGCMLCDGIVTMKLCVMMVWALSAVVGVCLASSDPASSTRSVGSSSLRKFFEELIAGDNGGLNDVWQKSPKLWRNVEGVNPDTLFSFQDAIAGAEGGLLERASVAKAEDAAAGKWVSEYVKPSTRNDLLLALEKGTIFFNGAGLDYPRLAGLGALAQDTFGLPANLNVYITKPGREVSVSPHTDAQNVLVMQTQGRKRWRVWPPPRRVPGKDPFGRGKNHDTIDPSELATEPLIDTWLEPGTVLYIPIGFPHATSTTDSDTSDEDGNTPTNDSDDEISCHVTLGLDTYFYGLCYTTLRAVAAARAKTRDTVDLFRIDDDLHDRLFSPIPLGFLRPKNLQEDEYESDAFINHVVAELHSINEAAAAASGVEPPSLGDDEAIKECVRFLLNHWRAIMNPDKYANVVEPPKPGTIEYWTARTNRNSKNQREEATQKQLAAFARG